MFDALIVSCEHGGNRIPRRLARLFKGEAKLLQTHRGWDIGALQVARMMASELGAPLHFATVSRLVVDLNRSPRHKAVLSSFTRTLDAAEKERLFAEHYEPYRDGVEAQIAEEGLGKVLHLSIHSFTPKLNGHVRTAEIGLLYDPKRPLELTLASRLNAALQIGAPHFRTRRNYPYLGYSDGFQTYLRKRFPASRYCAIEIEMNQAVVGTAKGRRDMAAALIGSLEVAL